jgi:hypothetical protein
MSWELDDVNPELELQALLTELHFGITLGEYRELLAAADPLLQRVAEDLYRLPTELSTKEVLQRAYEGGLPPAAHPISHSTQRERCDGSLQRIGHARVCDRAGGDGVPRRRTCPRRFAACSGDDHEQFRAAEPRLGPGVG